MSGTIIGSLPYIELPHISRNEPGGLLRPADVRRAETISHVYETVRLNPLRNRALSNPEQPQNGYQKLGDEYLAAKKYGLAIKAYMHTNEVLKTEEALKGWYSEIQEFVAIADKDLYQDSLPTVKSALDQYEKIFGRLNKMKERVKGRCQTQTLQAEMSNIYKKILESQTKIQKLNAPISIHEAKICLIDSSFKKELDLPSIIIHCSTYLTETRKLNPNARNVEEYRKIHMIRNQAQILLNRIEHLRGNYYYYQLDKSWDETLIKAIEKLDSNPASLLGDHTYFTREYIELFAKNPDLREGVMSLTEIGFAEVMKKIQGYLTQHLTRKFSFLGCLCMHPYEFALRPHTPLKVEEIREWIAEARKTHEIRDIYEILHIQPRLRDPLEEKEP